MMKTDIKTRLRSPKGLTILEMMAALLILSLVTAIAAGGIPAAVRAYTSVVDKANAQVLLSTTMTKLRDELGTATDVQVIGDVYSSDYIEYTNSEGSKTRIFLGKESSDLFIMYTETVGGTAAARTRALTSGSPKGIYIHEYVDYTPKDRPLKYTHLLVSQSASNNNLYALYDSIEYDAVKGIVTVNGLRVMKGTSTLAEIKQSDGKKEYKIKVLTVIR